MLLKFLQKFYRQIKLKVHRLICIYSWWLIYIRKNFNKQEIATYLIYFTLLFSPFCGFQFSEKIGAFATKTAVAELKDQYIVIIWWKIPLKITFQGNDGADQNWIALTTYPFYSPQQKCLTIFFHLTTWITGGCSTQGEVRHARRINFTFIISFGSARRALVLLVIIYRASKDCFKPGDTFEILRASVCISVC